MPLRLAAGGHRRGGDRPAGPVRRWCAGAALAASLVLAASPALPHSRLDTTSPEDGAVLTGTPAEVVLTFASGIRLTLVRVSHNDGPGHDLDPGRQTGFATRFTLAIEDRGSGHYRVEWRGLSVDGHVVRDTFSFRVR